MYKRPFWIQRIEQAWKKRSVVWLSGVRRVGKTTLAMMLPDTVYLNCDLPSVCRWLTQTRSLFMMDWEKGQPLSLMRFIVLRNQAAY